MNSKQLEIASMRILPAMKLVLIGIVQWPELSQSKLADKLNMDKSQLSQTTSKLVDLGLLAKHPVEESSRIKFEILT